MKRAHNPKAASPFRLPRLHPGIGKHFESSQAFGLNFVQPVRHAHLAVCRGCDGKVLVRPLVLAHALIGTGRGRGGSRPGVGAYLVVVPARWPCGNTLLLSQRRPACGPLRSRSEDGGHSPLDLVRFVLGRRRAPEWPWAMHRRSGRPTTNNLHTFMRPSVSPRSTPAASRSRVVAETQAEHRGPCCFPRCLHLGLMGWRSRASGLR